MTTRFDGVEFKGHKIVIPEDMTVKKAVSFLADWNEQQESFIAFNQTFDCHPLEGAVALFRALNDKYGFVSLKGTPGFFGTTPPTMVNVAISPSETVQVPWGVMQIPNIDGNISTGVQLEKNTPKFSLQAQLRRKDEPKMIELAQLIRDKIETLSIYRGKAFRIEFAPEPEFAMESSYHPKFMNLDGVSSEQLILNDTTAGLINISMHTPIENADTCRKLNIPLHRGILLEGNYGTGKTLAATVTAKVCEDNGWTFIYVVNTHQLAEALSFARAYTPCVLFAEDIDRVMDGERSGFIDSILNSVSGVDSKDTEIMLVLTTNHVDKINPAMLRPGRLDAVITVDEPDAKTTERLLVHYGDGALPTNASLKAVAKVLAGNIPAVIREVVERAKLASLSRGEKLISIGDLQIMADGMVKQVNLLNKANGKKDKEEFELVLKSHSLDTLVN